jgi:rhodanese-related sulfurtransferase
MPYEFPWQTLYLSLLSNIYRLKNFYKNNTIIGIRMQKTQWLLAILMLLNIGIATCSPAPTSAALEPAEPGLASSDLTEGSSPTGTVVVEEETPGAPRDTDLVDNIAAFLAAMENYNHLSPEALNTMINEGQELFLIDVRSASEVEDKGYIDGAVLIPLQQLGKNTGKLPPVDTLVVVYSTSGTLAAIGGTALGALGYPNVKILTSGSYGGWLAAGYPVVEGLPAEGEVYDVGFSPNLVEAIDTALTHINSADDVQITPKKLRTALVENSDMIVINVSRFDEVRSKGYIPADNRIHITLKDVIASMDRWPVDKNAQVTIYCGTGHRSIMAAAILWLNGYTNVTSLRGGYGAWIAAELPIVEYPVQ